MIPNRNAPRFVMVGLSGVSAHVLEQWFDQGRMPRLRSVMADAATGPLRSCSPTGSVAAWSSLITGRSPVNHGIYDRNVLDTTRNEIGSAAVDKLRVDDLWSIMEGAADHSRPTTTSRKRMACDTSANRRSTVRMIASPIDRPVQRRFVAVSTGNVWTRRPKSDAEASAGMARQAADIKSAIDAALNADRSLPWHGLSVRFRCLAGMQRHLWPELNPDHSVEWSPWRARIDGVLESLDGAVARIAELAEDRGAMLVIVSENGHGPCRSLVNVNGILRIHGIQRPAGRPTQFFNRSRRILARMHRRGAGRWLGSCGLLMGDPLNSRNDCDWSKTLAYAPFGEDSGLIWLTARARRHEGQCERVTMEIAEIFRLIADPATGAPVFSDVVPVRQRWNIDPIAAGWPDIVAVGSEGFAPVARWRYKEKARVFRADPGHPASSNDKGLIALKSPRIPAGVRLHAHVTDVVPTLLDHLDLPLPENLEGTPIGKIFERSIYQPHIRPEPTRAGSVPEENVRNHRHPVS